MIYSVISLTNSWHNGMPEVNDAHYTGLEITLEEPRIDLIMKALKNEGVLAKHITRRSLCIDEDCGDSITLRAQRDSSFLWELRPKELL